MKIILITMQNTNITGKILTQLKNYNQLNKVAPELITDTFGFVRVK